MYLPRRNNYAVGTRVPIYTDYSIIPIIISIIGSWHIHLSSKYVPTYSIYFNILRFLFHNEKGFSIIRYKLF